MSSLDLRRATHRCPLESLTNKKRQKTDSIYSPEAESSRALNGESCKETEERNEETNSCKNCRRENEQIIILKEALRDVIEQNECLRIRVIELEAEVTESEDSLQKKNKLIGNLHKAIKFLSQSEENQEFLSHLC